MAELDDIVDVEEVFCGWERPHRFHFATDLVTKSPLFICEGYERNVEDD